MGNPLGILDRNTGEQWWQVEMNAMLYSKHLHNGEFPTNEAIIERIERVLSEVEISQRKETERATTSKSLYIIRDIEEVVKAKKEFL